MESVSKLAVLVTLSWWGWQLYNAGPEKIIAGYQSDPIFYPITVQILICYLLSFRALDGRLSGSMSWMVLILMVSGFTFGIWYTEHKYSVKPVDMTYKMAHVYNVGWVIASLGLLLRLLGLAGSKTKAD